MARLGTCSACGKEVAPDARECPDCGKLGPAPSVANGTMMPADQRLRLDELKLHPKPKGTVGKGLGNPK